MNCFNGEQFVREAMASVLAQTCPDWELIFWDNRSTDASAAIAQSFDDPRIRYYLADEHTGLSAARNRALEHATGEWIAFLDTDDVWLPEKLSKQIARLERDRKETGLPEAGMVYGRSLVIQPDGTEAELLRQFIDRPLPEGHILRRLLLEGVFAAAPTVMIRRAVLDEIGGVNEQYSCAFDYHFLVAICENHRALAVQDCIAKYRVHHRNYTLSVGEALYWEPLAIVETWGYHLTAAELSRRKKEYHTLLGVQLLLNKKPWRAGRELLLHGSLTYLAGRLFSRLLRGRFGAH
jgi:glycosyltransferase involved in cell wall biosynthesis